MCLRMIPSWCTVPRTILTLLFIIRRQDTTPRVWQFRLALAWPWERSGAGVGAGAAAGVATITSTLTTTTISTATRTLAVATATTSAVGTAPRINPLAAVAIAPRLNQFVAVTAAEAIDGNTTRHIAAALRMETGRPRTGSAERRAVIRSPIARPAPGNRLAGRVEICPATAPEGEA